MRTWLLARLGELAGEEALDAPAAPPIELNPRWAESRYAQEPPGEAEAIFQRRWALTVLEFTVATMSAEYAARGEKALFPELLPFAGYDSGDEDRYAAAAARVGRTIGAMHKEVYDFRQRQRELLLFFTGDTLLDPAAAPSEITALLCACDAPGPAAANAKLPTAIGNLHPDEMLARAMQSVKMTGGADGWQPPSLEEAARLFPQYEVRSLLGRGGMGAVYQGRQTELDRLVAIKLLPLEVSVDRDFADRFRREARAMAKLQHPNIIDVHDFGTTAEGHLYFVMEYVDGVDLHTMIRGAGLEPAQALEIIGAVCDALAYAHAEGVVHRDIKPANVMVSRKGQVKVADFGLARLTDSGPEALGHTVTGLVMGTPDYMAPEQKRGMNVDLRADIYSLGVMLYEMLCREVPQGIFDPPSKRVAVDSRVDQVVIKAMQQQPDRRYQNTQEMKADVTAASTPLPQAPVLFRLPPGGMSRAITMARSTLPLAHPAARPPGPKIPRVLVLAVLVLLAVIATGLFYFHPWKKSAPPSASPGTGRTDVTPTASSTTPAQTIPWQPLFTEAEWMKPGPDKGREIVDGLLHLAHNAPGSAALKPQPTADGAIRARIHWQKSAVVGFIARYLREGYYKAETHGGNTVALSYIQRYVPGVGDEPINLGSYTLPKPLHLGDTLLLEFRMEGDHLTVLVDGVTAIDVRDSRSAGPGSWGLSTGNGWYESAEVQSLPPGFGAWQPLFTEAEWNQTVPGQREVAKGCIHLRVKPVLKPQPAADGAIQARIQWREGSPGGTGVIARFMPGQAWYKLMQDATRVDLLYVAANGATVSRIGTQPLPKRLEPGDRVLLELRLQGDHLTGLVDGAVLIDAHDSRIAGSGQWGLVATDGWFESVEVRPGRTGDGAGRTGGLGQTGVTPAASPASSPGQWQPLFTPAEWNAPKTDKRETVDCHLHLLGLNVLKPQPFADGAIRARIRFEENSHFPGFLVHVTPGEGCYRAEINGGGTGLALKYYAPGTTGGPTGQNIGGYKLPKPLQPGDPLLLELRMEGDRLTFLANGVVAITAVDSRAPGPGQWGIMSDDGWFESVEVQSPAAGQTSTGPARSLGQTGGWQPLFTDAEWKLTEPGHRDVVDGRVHLRPNSVVKPQPEADGAIRTRIQWREGTAGGTGVIARLTPGRACYKLQLSAAHKVELFYLEAIGSAVVSNLGSQLLPRPLQPGDTVLLELRLQGDHLTGLVDGAVLIDARDSHLPGPGQWGIISNDGWFESVEVQSAGRTGDASTSWQPLFTDAEWKQTIPGHRQVVNGVLRVEKGSLVSRPQPFADGAIRARIQFQPDYPYCGAHARMSEAQGRYVAQYDQDGREVRLSYYPPDGAAGATGLRLGTYTFPKPLQPGDTQLLELRLQGDHLTVLVDGVVAITAEDSRAPGLDGWGVVSSGGWFESLEMQSPGRTSAF
jgi:serine/threonine protein kinase